MPDAASEARELIRIVTTDAGLPIPARRRAGALVGLAESNPNLALERLIELSDEIRPRLIVETPATDYARCVSIEVYWRYNLGRDRKELFRSPEDYRRRVEIENDPAARLLADLAPGILVPAAHSWLVPLSDLDGLSGTQVRMRLNMRQDPPYVVLVLSADRMRIGGVAVRSPRGIDAIPGRHVQWHPGDVRNERIDLDIPASAVEGIEWRP